LVSLDSLQSNTSLETGVITLSHEIQSKPPYDKRSFYISKVGFSTLISCPVFGVHYRSLSRVSRYSPPTG
ncbi:MAG: hypothetical protein M1511_06930, partial [Deltaproteobacteria bacterium]|nr:hypothetical protein [Deltaproteobacteria bacterium]